MRTRIKQLRTTLNLTQEEFGQKLGVSRGVITNIELNRVPPKDLFVDLICDVFGVNRKWLETGEGEMFQDINEDLQFEKLCTEIAKSDDAMLKNAMKLYWSLSDESKKAVWNFVKSLQAPDNK